MSDRQLSEEEKSAARRIFGAGGSESSQICSFCGGFHHRACPRVAEFELYDSQGGKPGALKRVQFWPEGTWDDSYVIWPEDIADADADADTADEDGDEH